MKHELVNIVTFLWGDWCKDRNVDYVNALFSGVLQHLEQQFVFTLGVDEENREKCVSQCDERILIHTIDSPSWTGCLPKLNAYNPDMKLTGEVLVFDLDTIITGPLEPFVNAIDDGLTTRAWFRGIPQGIWLSGGDLLGFKAGWGSALWEAFIDFPEWMENKISEGGRERYVYRKLVKPTFWQKKLPGRYLSYKNHLRGVKELPQECSLVSCHGKPRPHEINEPWVRQHWCPSKGTYV